MHPVMRAAHLVFEICRAGRQRIGVRHLKDGGDSAHDRRAGTRLEIFLMRRARLAKMHLRVDHARQDVQTLGVDDLAGRGPRQVADLGDFAGADADIARADSILIDQNAALENQIESLGHGSRCLKTRQNLPCGPVRAD